MSDAAPTAPAPQAPDKPSLTHGQLIDRVHEFTQAAGSWLVRSMRDDDYYHHIQWSKDEKDELVDRGSPIVTTNRIMPKINTILGVRQSYEMSPTGMARTPLHELEAEAFTDIIRAIIDMVGFEELEDEANEDIGKVGYGGYVFGIKADENRSPLGAGVAVGDRSVAVLKAEQVQTTYEITCDHVEWDNLAWDPRSRKKDFSDASWVAVIKWRDVEDVRSDPQYRDTQGVITDTERGSADVTAEHPFADKPETWFQKNTRRIQVAEMYYKEPAENGRGWDWYVCHMTGGGFLIPPVRVSFVDERGLNYCPLVIESAYRNRHGERFGVIRGFVSPQDEINHRRSRALHEITGGPGYWYEESAIADPVETSQELSKAAPAVRLNDGAMSDGEGRPAFGFIDKLQNTEGQLRLLAEAHREIDQVGPQPEPQGDAMSGTAFAMNQDAGVKQLGPLFKRMKNLRRRSVKVMWWLARQFWTRQRYLRVMDRRAPKGYRFLPINRRTTRGERLQELMQMGVSGPEAVNAAMGAAGAELFGRAAQAIASDATQRRVQVDPAQMEQLALMEVSRSPLAAEEFTMNDIARLDVDIVVDEQPYFAVAAQEQLAEMARMQREGVAQFPPQMFVKHSNLRDKDEIIAAMQPPPPDPQAAQTQQAQVQLSLASLDAQVQALRAQAAKWMAEAQATGARAARDGAEAVKTQAETVRIDSEIDENFARAEKLRADAARARNPILPPLTRTARVPQ